jgi:hypothetical protein
MSTKTKARLESARERVRRAAEKEVVVPIERGKKK